MSFTPSIAQNIRTEVEDIIEMVSGVESQTKTAYEIEGQLWWSMLALGQQLLQLFFTMREKQETQLKSYDVDDVNYPYVGQKKATVCVVIWRSDSEARLLLAQR